MDDYCELCEWCIECVDYVPYGSTNVPMKTYDCRLPRGKACPFEEAEEEE